MPVLLLERIHGGAESILDDAGIAHQRHDGALSGADLAAKLAGVRVVGLRSKSRIDEATLANAPELDAIGCFCIGTNQVDLDAAARRGIVVFNAPFSNTRSVAELTLAEVVALHRRLIDKSMAMHRGEWDKSAAHAHEVRGRSLGIVGYGHIGSQVSVLAEAFGMRVLYHDVVPKLPLGNAQPVRSLGELLGRSDVVTVHVPATPATHNLIGAAEIAAMRPGAFLINNARGSVIDLEAAAAALRDGQLGGGAFDVFPDEPTQSRSSFQSPVAGLPNVMLTPHIGGSTEEAQESIALDVATKIVRYLQTGTTTTSVNVPEVELPHQRDGQLRILHFHQNVPGVLSQMHAVMADFGVNINAEYLQSTGDLSYVILDVDQCDAREMHERLCSIPETIRVRIL